MNIMHKARFLGILSVLSVGSLLPAMALAITINCSSIITQAAKAQTGTAGYTIKNNWMIITINDAASGTSWNLSSDRASNSFGYTFSPGTIYTSVYTGRTPMVIQCNIKTTAGILFTFFGQATTTYPKCTGSGSGTTAGFSCVK